MQPTHRSNRILQPARNWFIYSSLLVALCLNYIPVGRLPGMPDWVVLVLAFWAMREPLRVGLGTAFIFGLLVDIGHGAAMGQHALAYILLAFIIASLSRRLLWVSALQQSFQILPFLWMVQLVMLVIRLLAGAEFPGWWYFLSGLSGALLWAPLNFILLLPQYQPLERDDNRPI